MTRHRPAGPFLVAVILLVSLDLTAKWWAVNHLAGGSRSLPGPVDLQLSYNTGIAFGLVSDLPSSILVVLTAAALTGVVHLWRTKQAPTGPAILFVAGGAANVVDRIDGAGVVDMLHTGWWPTFNIRSEEHTSELQSLMRIPYAGICFKKQKNKPSYRN